MKRPSTEALIYMSGWKSGAAGTETEVEMIPDALVPVYVQGYDDGVKARHVQWLAARETYPNV